MNTNVSANGKITYITGAFDNIFDGKSETAIAAVYQVSTQYRVGGCQWVLSDGKRSSYYKTKTAALAAAKEAYGK